MSLMLLVGVRLGIPPILLVDPPKPLASPKESDGSGLEAELRVQRNAAVRAAVAKKNAAG